MVVAISLSIAAGPALAQDADPATVEFDPETLKARGIDPKVAEYFARAARFPGGTTQVELTVNGFKRGTGPARFDDTGRLCFDADFLQWAGLVTPPGWEIAPPEPAADACRDYTQVYPQARIALDPNKGAVGLVVPTGALRHDAPAPTDYATGGVAGILNYDILAIDSRFGDNHRRYLQASTEIGFNLADWIVRSRQTMARQNGSSRSQYLYTYAQKTLVDRKAVLQVGQINMASPLFAGANLTGVQLTPETGLRRMGNTPVVQGIAQTEARVEVRQAGALIHTTLVPAGPFTLTDIPVLSGGVDLDVSVIEATGAQQRIIVPAASFYAAPVSDQHGYTLTLGKVRHIGNFSGSTPWVASGARTWAINRGLTATAGALVSDQYQSLGGSVSSLLTPTAQWSLRGLASRDQRLDKAGAQVTASLSAQLAERLSVSVSASKQTRGFRNLLDADNELRRDAVGNNGIGDDDGFFTDNRQDQYSASLQYSHRRLGGFSAGIAQSSYADNAPYRNAHVAWGRSFRYATVNLQASRSVGSNRRFNDKQMYLTVDVPLGRRSVQGYATRTGRDTRFGARYSERVNDALSYRLGVEDSTRDGGRIVSGHVNALPGYAQLGLGFTRSETGTSWSGTLRGGALVHADGVTLSPHHLRDTLGLISIGDLSRVKFHTPAGPVWSDPWGRAVIASLNSYSDTRIEVATASLPRNVDIKNGFKIVRLGHGAVGQADFAVVRTRRVLLEVTLPSGEALAKGTAVVDADDELAAVVGDNGSVFLSNGHVDMELFVDLPGGGRCTLDYRLPDKPDGELLYEAAKAVCEPVDE